MADPALPFPPVRNLHDFWERRVNHRPTPAGEWLAERMLLDALGLGLDQTLRFLGQERPGFAAFLHWIEAVAGQPDALAIARYHATRNGSAPPLELTNRLRSIEAMPPVFGPAALAEWDAQGYVVLPNAITPVQAAEAAALLWSTVGASADDPATWYGPKLQGMMVPLYQHPALEAARRSPRVHKAFAQLWGTADLWMRVDQMSFNPPEGAGHRFQAPRLHWDVSLARPIPFATQGILYLSDTAANQGALELVPGFHHRLDAWLNALGDIDPRHVDLSGDAIPIAASAGDLIIWRQDLPHGASPNRADRPRLAQYVNMYPATLTQQAQWR